MLGEKSWKVVSKNIHIAISPHISLSICTLANELRFLDNRYKCSSCDRHVDAVKR